MATNKLTSRIMRRVYGIWFVRYVAPRLLGTIALFGVAYRVTADSFFVSEIVANFLSVAAVNVWALPRFIASALNSADPFSLVAISAMGMVGFFLAVKLLRSVRSIVASGMPVADEVKLK